MFALLVVPVPGVSGCAYELWAFWLVQSLVGGNFVHQTPLLGVVLFSNPCFLLLTEVGTASSPFRSPNMVKKRYRPPERRARRSGGHKQEKHVIWACYVEWRLTRTVPSLISSGGSAAAAP